MSTTPDLPPEDRAAVTPPSVKLLERRRLLLKGLAKGTAAAAAVVPLQSLATTKLLTGNNMGCSVSGMQSAVRSQTGGATYCKGYKHIVYTAKSKWPGYNTTYPGEGYFTVSGREVSTRSSCKFSTVFPGSGSSSTLSCFEIVNGAAGYSPAERAWIVAVLNSKWQVDGKALNFPYSPGVVLTFYGSTNHANAQTLFTGHLMASDWF